MCLPSPIPSLNILLQAELQPPLSYIAVIIILGLITETRQVLEAALDLGYVQTGEYVFICYDSSLDDSTFVSSLCMYVQYNEALELKSTSGQLPGNWGDGTMPTLFEKQCSERLLSMTKRISMFSIAGNIQYSLSHLFM